MKRQSVVLREGEVVLPRRMIAVRASHSTAKALAIMAEANGKTLSHYIADLLDKHVEGQGYG